VVSQYFWPEPFIINELVLKLKEQGHSVSVFTGKPNYPDGNLYSGYKSSGIQEEEYQGIPVYRIPLRPRNNGGAKNLILNYLSFIGSGLIRSVQFSRKRSFDAILVYVPSPITSVIPGILLKWLTRSHLAVWVQDIWPESVQATGFIKNRLVLKCIEALVRGIYFFSDSLLVQSSAFIAPVNRLVKLKSKVIYYPNSAQDMLIHDPIKESLPIELVNLLDTHFCIVFAGNIGSAQAVETIVEAAMNLRHLEQVKLVLVGSGSMSHWVQEHVALKGLNNVVLPGRFPANSMPEIYSRAKGLLVTLKRDDIFTYTIPCKIQSYLSSGRPIIGSLDGEGARVIIEAGAGMVSPAEDPNALAEQIERLYHMSDLERAQLGKSGRAYFLQHFEISRQSHRLVEILEERIGQRG